MISAAQSALELVQVTILACGLQTAAMDCNEKTAEKVFYAATLKSEKRCTIQFQKPTDAELKKEPVLPGTHSIRSRDTKHYWKISQNCK